MTTAPPERSVPKPVFTDAEAGAKEFPDSTARRFNYYTPQKRKQTHYEDVTVEVQPDPRHYLSQGWLYGFSDGRGGYPLDWTVAEGVGLGPARARALPRFRRQGLRLAGARLARVPRPERGVGAHPLPLQLQRRAAGQPEHRGRQADEGVRAVEPELGPVRRAQRRRLDARGPRPRAVPVRQRQPAGADEHAQQRDLGEQHAPDPGRPGPGAVQPDADRGDRRLRRRRAPRDLEQRPGLAGRPRGRRAADRRSTTGARRSSPPTWSSSRWSASCSAASWCSRRRRATATSSPPRSSARRSTTSPSGTCATPRRCSSC